MIVVTLSEVIGIVVIAAIIIISIIVIIYESIMNKFFRKNCYECKYYKFYSADAPGSNCKYICKKTEEIDINGLNDRCKYRKCKNFIKKESE